MIKKKQFVAKKPVCYQCFNNNGTEDDHVPPQSFFQDKSKLNLITVPICKDCHNKFDQMDERCRNYLFFSKPIGEKINKSQKEKLVRGLKTNKNQLLQILSSLKTVPASDGNLLRTDTQFHIPADELNNFARRVARGLLYRKKGYESYKELDLEVTCYMGTGKDDMFDDAPLPLEEYTVEPGVFSYKLITISEGKVRLVLVCLEFYQRIGFTVFGSTELVSIRGV